MTAPKWMIDKLRDRQQTCSLALREKAAHEIERVHALNAELVEALELIAGFTRSQFADSTDMAIECVITACKALAKAKGENNVD